MTSDVAIIGAGIVGAACAGEYARAGLRTLVLDQAFPASGATASGMGHIVVMDDSDAQFALTRYSRELWMQLAPQLPASAEYQSAGTLWVAADENEMNEARRKHCLYRDRNVAAEILDPKALKRAEPELREGLAGALLVPGDSVIYPPPVTQWLLKQRNISVACCRAISANDEGVNLADGRRVSAGLIINAAGIGAAQLTPGIPIEIQPRKGHLVITDRYPGFLQRQIVELGYLNSAHSVAADSVAFNVQPRVTGQLLIGSSRQYGAQHPDIDRVILSRMVRRAISYMPRIAQLSAVRAWTGFRAATPDKLPLIGRCSGYRNVFIAAGHEGLGITTSLGTARLLADETLGRGSAIPRDAYSPERMAPAHA